MANEEQLSILRQGVKIWNQWRRDNQDEIVIIPRANLSESNLSNADLYQVWLSRADFSKANLSGADLGETLLHQAKLNEANLRGANFMEADMREADLSETDLSEADLSGTNLNEAKLVKSILRGAWLSEANLSGANLNEAILIKAKLSNANLSGADLTGADLSEADLSHANLSRATLSGSNLRRTRLSGANLSGANLTEANFTGADLRRSILVETIVSDAIISESYVYGINIWNLEGEFKEQNELIITPKKQSAITVDNIEIAQFVYLIMNNKKVRNVINTLTSKTVLILGRFALTERKKILDGLRGKLREYNLLPIVFDFERPVDKDFTETIKTLAGMCYFIIADVTNPKSSPLELQATVPDYQIPFVPIIQEGERPFAMMVDLKTKYNWVLNTVSYDSQETLMNVLKPLIIDPAMKKRQELRIIKAQVPEVISGKDYLDKESK
jgi:uncharacterized protein YjbI with pentapeptide repeats